MRRPTVAAAAARALSGSKPSVLLNLPLPSLCVPRGGGKLVEKSTTVKNQLAKYGLLTRVLCTDAMQGRDKQ